MKRRIESITRPSAPGVKEDAGALKLALAQAREARDIAIAEKVQAEQRETLAVERGRLLADHYRELQRMAVRLCQRVLGDGGDLGGLETELTRLGIEWNTSQSESAPAPRRRG